MFNLTLHKLLLLALMAGATFAVTLVTLHSRGSWPHRLWARYVAHLDGELRHLFLSERGQQIATIQAILVVVTLAAAAFVQPPQALVALAVVFFGPGFYLRRERKRRLHLIEVKVDTFLTSLANALKTTPSIGNALAYTEPLLTQPLKSEVGLALKEMRMGNTVDQALSNMGARVRSVSLDAALGGILIGRQIGGDLPKILESTAATLREMTRLQGYVRSKTAEGKAQLLVLAAFPGLILVLFDSVSDGYFAPLAGSVVGWAVIAGAAVLWLAALLVARKILEVDL